MYFFIAFLPVLFFALAAGRLIRRSFWLTLPVSLFLVVLIMFVCGLLGALAAGPFVVVLFGIASLVYLCVSLPRDSYFRKHPTSFFTVDLALVFGGTILIILLTAGRKVTDMDSFEQWAYIVKKMCLTNSLLSARGQYASTLSYPPGLGLLQYYFARFSPVFNEADLFRARDLLALALLLPLIQVRGWGRWRTLLLAPVAFLLPFLEYATFSSSLEVDPMLGLLFAWLILFASDHESVSGFRLLGLALGSFLLSFTKVSGVLFSILAGVILFFQWMYRTFCRTSETRAYRSRWILPALTVLVAGVVGWLAWRLYVSADAAGGSFSTILSLKNGLLQYQKETIVNFLDALFASESGAGIGRLSPVLWIAAVPFLTAVAVRFLSNDETAATRSLLNALLLTAGYLVWLVALLIGYLTNFVEGEALSLAAFPRYLSSYQLGALLVCTYSILKAIESREPRAQSTLLALLLIVLLFTAPLRSVFDATVGAPYANSKTVDWRQRYAPASRYYERLDPADVKVCYLDENPSEPGYSFALFQFEALPVDVEKAVAWRLGGPYYEADYYSLSPSAAEWEQALQSGGFTHLYLRSSSAYFESAYGSLFAEPSEIRSDAYYEIAQQDGHIRFKLVDTTN